MKMKSFCDYLWLSNSCLYDVDDVIVERTDLDFKISVALKKDQIKNNRQSAPKPYAAFPHPSDATHKIWSRLANWLQRYSSWKCEQ